MLSFSMLTGFRKGKDVEHVFGRGFYWGEALDALADVYNGVRDFRSRRRTMLISCSSSSGLS